MQLHHLVLIIPIGLAQRRLNAWAAVDAGINEATEINLEMTVIGDVVRTAVLQLCSPRLCQFAGDAAD